MPASIAPPSSWSRVPMNQSALPLSLRITILSFAVFLRSLVGFQPHSGQDNYHGSRQAYGGDYEAQRHWMELTLHVPIGGWYWYDLEYWGLDYPPLTAYVSYICGLLSSYLVGPNTMELDVSRGYEDTLHKAYMRATVLALDLLVCIPAIWVVAHAMHGGDDKKFLWTVVLSLSQPAIILIDHGHFQYNTVSLGLSMWAAHYMTQPAFSNCVAGSVLFCLALNFKQMSLYYAPAVFCYLLGRCCRGVGSSSKFAFRFGLLGLTVVATFALLWWPFLMRGPSDRTTTYLERFAQVMHRIFPFQRGLFEGKVSNLWCALSVKPLSIRERIDPDLQPLIALLVTIVLILPACVKMFRVGQSLDKRDGGSIDKRMLLWGMTSTALAFYLASFQVHEKSSLLALASVCLLLWDDFWFVQWFSVATTWTLWPLICVDRLQVVYVCLLLVYMSLVWLCSENNHATTVKSSAVTRHTMVNLLVVLSTMAMVILHISETFVTPPSKLPDLFPVLWSIVGCGMFCMSLLVTWWHLYRHDSAPPRKVKQV